MRKRQSFLGTLVLAVVFFIAGFTAYQYLTKPIAEEAEASKNWPTVEGVITHSELIKSRDSDGKDMYSASVRYEYSVDNKKYSDSGIRVTDSKTNVKSSVKKTLKKYAKGTHVTVYYDPEFPGTAVLEPGTGLLLGILLKLPLLFCAISVLMVFGLFKRLFLGR